jgi:hypothetical protein
MEPHRLAVDQLKHAGDCFTLGALNNYTILSTKGISLHQKYVNQGQSQICSHVLSMFDTIASKHDFEGIHV